MDLNKISFFIKNNIHPIGVFVVFLFHVFSISYWLYIDKSQPSWGDQTDYLLRTFTFYDNLSFTSLEDFKKILFTSGLRPPLFMYLPSIFYLFNYSIDAAISTNIIFLFILYFSTYGIGKTISNKKVGLLAVLVISFFPMIYGMSRNFLLDFPLTAMFSLSIYLLILSNNFKHKKYSILLGFVIGLSMLVKWSFPIFFIYPFYFILKRIKVLNISFKHKYYQLKNILITIFIAVLTCSYWYLPNLLNILEVFKLSAPGSDVIPLFGLSGVFNLKSFLFYIIGIINHIGSFSFMIIFIIGLFFYKKFDDNDKLFIRNIAFVLVFFTILIENKEFRYVLPLSPLFAVFISKTLLCFISENKIRIFSICLVISISIVQFFYISFGKKSFEINFSVPTFLEDPLSTIILFSKNHRYGYKGYEHSWIEAPSNEEWKTVEILNSIQLNSDSKKKIPKLFIIPFLEKFQIGHFKLYAKMNGINISLTHRNRKFVEFKNQMVDYDFIISKTGNINAFHSIDENINDINNFFNFSYRDNFEIIDSFLLPDNSFAFLYKNKFYE